MSAALPMHDRPPEQQLDRLRELLDRLEQILGDETAALLARNVDALLATVADKRRTLGEIGRLLPDALLANRGDLQERLLRCRSLNDAAGSAIAALRHHTSHALSLLGIDSAPPAYGESRRGPGQVASRALAVG
jgi:flagellar biosynthesis/type III secretory pathway chaperone